MRIRRDSVNGKTQYTYPPQYVAEKINAGFGPIYEGGERAIDAQSRGLDDEYILFGVRDEDADSFLNSDGYVDNSGFVYSAIEVTKEKALEDCGNWITPQEKIIDINLVTSILAKSVRGEVLTQEETDNIDPTIKTSTGIVMTPSLIDILDSEVITPSDTAINIV